MAIGNYWECVLPEGTATPPLQRVVSESTMLAQQHFSSWRFGPEAEDIGGADFAFMGFATGEIRAVVHLVKPQGRPNFYLHSAFPWLFGGAPARLTVYGTETNHFGLEGFIEVGIPDGPAMKFFDPLFALNKVQYKIGSEYSFSIGGLSLDLKMATPQHLRITNPETVVEMREMERAASGEPWSPPDYIEVDTSRAKGLLPAAADTSDYYLFQGPVRAVRKANFLDRPFAVYRTAVLDHNSDDLSVDIYVDQARLKGRSAPAIGDMVSGTLWLQGCLAEASV
jgi:hypothetical protein